jgi:membrane associated rhomboid family serine protease
MDKRGGDNIGHSAHLWGGLYGVAFIAIVKPELFKEFLEKLMHP